MTFDEWYESEGRAMTEGGCSQEIVARAAFFVATNNEREACVALCEGLMDETAWKAEKGRYNDCAVAIRDRSNALAQADAACGVSHGAMGSASL